jgi:hypothetical protein
VLAAKNASFNTANEQCKKSRNALCINQGVICIDQGASIKELKLRYLHQSKSQVILSETSNEFQRLYIKPSINKCNC